ncbi:hypothetical protein C8Q75DRAFT_102482 [Abortiporus biennis]|nr:hypothetical protein C8Q75DRAFT_102482 [Abortiporus biennis]
MLPLSWQCRRTGLLVSTPLNRVFRIELLMVLVLPHTALHDCDASLHYPIFCTASDVEMLIQFYPNPLFQALPMTGIVQYTRHSGSWREEYGLDFGTCRVLNC